MEFKVIEGFDQYRIYQDGRVYSCKRKIVLKTSLRDGYKYVDLYNTKSIGLSDTSTDAYLYNDFFKLSKINKTVKTYGQGNTHR